MIRAGSQPYVCCQGFRLRSRLVSKNNLQVPFHSAPFFINLLTSCPSSASSYGRYTAGFLLIQKTTSYEISAIFPSGLTLTNREGKITHKFGFRPWPAAENPRR